MSRSKISVYIYICNKMYHVRMFPKPPKSENDHFSVQTEGQPNSSLVNNKRKRKEWNNRMENEDDSIPSSKASVSKELLKKIIARDLQMKLTKLALNQSESIQNPSSNQDEDSLQCTEDSDAPNGASIEPKPGNFNVCKAKTTDIKTILEPINMLVEAKLRSNAFTHCNKKEECDSVVVEKEHKDVKDKSTYCRPVLNNYSQEYFFYKMMDRNEKLQNVISRLIYLREEERKEEAWKKYINSLRSKHGYTASAKYATKIALDENSIDDIMKDLFKTKFKNDIPEPGDNILNNFYEIAQNYQCDSKYNEENLFLDKEMLCYPTSSQVLNMHRLGKKRKLLNPKPHFTKSIQTEASKEEPEESYKDKLMKISANLFNKKLNVLDSENKVNRNTLINIETKLEEVLDTLNAFINEVRNKKNIHKRNRAIACNSQDRPEVSNSEHYKKSTNFVCNLLTQSIPFNQHPKLVKKVKSTNAFKVNESRKYIKHEPVKDNEEDAIRNEVSTNMSSIFLKNKLSSKEIKIDVNDAKKMTIAVNTDPLGLLALLAISTDTLKKILSYVPSLPNFSIVTQYWSLEQKLKMGSERVLNYICSICGANFKKPSQLNEHIKTHNLDSGRDCCKCRHVLETQGVKEFNLFHCQYCGRGFTRAYCCYLHEISCPCRLDRKLDKSSNLKRLS